MKLRLGLALGLFAGVAAIAAIALQIEGARPPAPLRSLTAYVPQDALLSIESPDFAALLHRWSDSPEARSWLVSDNHSVFENSRLFGRLTGAQDAFAKAAGIPAGVDFLNQVAGQQSVFAWYDIANLEFLYITRMPAAQANQTQLLQSRASFERRQAGGSDFYIRTSAQAFSAVAFAQVTTPSGDLLLLATREDLIANALELIAGNSPIASLTQDPWFHDASLALPSEKTPPALHMVLNLDRIAVDPHFRSHWIQRNISWMHQYRATTSNLYLEGGQFREERVLLPKSPESIAPDSPETSQLASLAPAGAGVFRSLATQDPSIAVNAIQDYLLGSFTAPPANPEYAPDPELSTPQAGSTSDLETRIDAPPPIAPGASFDALTQTLHATGLSAVLTLASAQTPETQDGLWVPIHSAVVLRATSPWSREALASALQQALRGSLTASNFGIEFQPSGSAGQTIYALTGPRPLLFAITASPSQGNLAVLTDNQPLLLQILANAARPAQPGPISASYIAAFDHTSQHAPYARLTSLIDGTNIDGTNNAGVDANSGPVIPQRGFAQVPAKPTFFSRNVGSLSTTFAALQSERIVQRTVDSNLRETVTYQWQTP